MAEPSQADQFVELMVAYQGRLFAYVLSLLGDPDAANDVLQETNVVLWRQWRDFQPGTNFKAWAFRITHFQIMAHRQRRLRDRLEFDDELIGALAIEAKQLDETWEERSQTLSRCIERLALRDRDAVRLRYVEGFSVSQLAERFNRSANAISQLLFRVRERLVECAKRAETT